MSAGTITVDADLFARAREYEISLGGREGNLLNRRTV